MQRYCLALIAVVAFLACDRPKEPDPRQMAARALTGALTYPLSKILSVSAGTDAAEVQLSAQASVEQVALWYRQALPLNGWELKHEGKKRGGEMTIYAEKAARPLWIMLRPSTAGPGTTYTLIGAVLDDSTAPPAVPPAR